MFCNCIDWWVQVNLSRTIHNFLEDYIRFVTKEWRHRFVRMKTDFTNYKKICCHIYYLWCKGSDLWDSRKEIAQYIQQSESIMCHLIERRYCYNCHIHIQSYIFNDFLHFSLYVLYKACIHVYRSLWSLYNFTCN